MPEVQRFSLLGKVSTCSYEDLKPSYVIFICTSDPFKMDEAVYFFRSWDVEKGLPLKYLSYKIVLNTACSLEKVRRS